MTDLSGRTALVTGGNRGIGKATAKALAAAGARLVISGRCEAANREAAAELRQSCGVEVEAVEADVAIESDCRRLIARTVKCFGQLDILINNAGIISNAPVAELSTKDFDRVLKTNLYGAFWCAREAYRAMANNPLHAGLRGSIINISSVAGKEAWSGTAAYSASKFGLMALTQSLADEGKNIGIRTTAICPALVATAMTGASGEDILQPEDIARTVSYLLQLSPAAWPTEVILPRRGAD